MFDNEMKFCEVDQVEPVELEDEEKEKEEDPFIL